MEKALHNRESSLTGAEIPERRGKRGFAIFQKSKRAAFELREGL